MEDEIFSTHWLANILSLVTGSETWTDCSWRLNPFLWQSFVRKEEGFKRMLVTEDRAHVFFVICCQDVCVVRGFLVFDTLVNSFVRTISKLTLSVGSLSFLLLKNLQYFLFSLLFPAKKNSHSYLASGSVLRFCMFYPVKGFAANGRKL